MRLGRSCGLRHTHRVTGVQTVAYDNPGKHTSPCCSDSRWRDRRHSHVRTARHGIIRPDRQGVVVSYRNPQAPTCARCGRSLEGRFCGFCGSDSAAHSSARTCPFCGEQILAVAVKCKHCGEFLDETRSRGSRRARPEPAAGVPGQSRPSSESLRTSTWMPDSGGQVVGALFSAAFVIIGCLFLPIAVLDEGYPFRFKGYFYDPLRLPARDTLQGMLLIAFAVLFVLCVFLDMTMSSSGTRVGRRSAVVLLLTGYVYLLYPFVRGAFADPGHATYAGTEFKAVFPHPVGSVTIGVGILIAVQTQWSRRKALQRP